MPDIRNLFSTIKKVELEVGGDVLHVEYDDSAYTPELEEKLNALDRENGSSGPGLALGLSMVVKKWDLIGTDGKPYPLDVNSLRKLPTSFLLNVTMAIGRNNRPDPTSSGSFGGSS